MRSLTSCIIQWPKAQTWIKNSPEIVFCVFLSNSMVKQTNARSKVFASFLRQTLFKDGKKKRSDSLETKRKCRWINPPCQKKALKKKKWWYVWREKKKTGRAKIDRTFFLNIRGVISSKSAVTRATAASAHTWFWSVSLVRLLWFLIYIPHKRLKMWLPTGTWE